MRRTTPAKSTARAPSRTRDVLTRTLDLFGDAWTFLVMQEAFFGVHRFVDFRTNLRMPRATLAARLRLLLAHRMLECSTREGSSRESYRLTATGLGQYDYALALTRFGDRWLSERDPPRLRLRHACGRFLGAEPHCRHCNDPLEASDVRFEEISSRALGAGFVRRTRASGNELAYLRGRDTSVARTLTAIGDRWSLLIVYDALAGPRRFEDFVRHLGVAPNILADRLRYLTNAGLLARERRHAPLRLEYRLTRRGEALYEVLLALLDWACRWLRADPADRPHHRCGLPAELVYRCRACGAVVKPTDVGVCPSRARRAAV
jgi:DNA-binding HxlR family transcriptional regulator